MSEEFEDVPQPLINFLNKHELNRVRICSDMRIRHFKRLKYYEIRELIDEVGEDSDVGKLILESKSKRGTYALPEFYEIEIEKIQKYAAKILRQRLLYELPTERMNRSSDTLGEQVGSCVNELESLRVNDGSLEAFDIVAYELHSTDEIKTELMDDP